MKKIFLILSLFITVAGFSQTIIDPSLTPTTARINAAIQDAISTSGTNTYTGSRTGLTNVTDKAYSVLFVIGNSGAATFNLNGTGAVTIKKFSSGSLVDVASGDISAGETKRLRYNGTYLIIEGGTGSSGGGGSGTVESVTGAGVNNTDPDNPVISFPLSTEVQFTSTGTISATNVQAAIEEVDGEKQNTLVSGTNIKTVGGTSLLGSGDIAVGGTGTVTSTSVVTANGVSGSVATATTTPAITLTLGAITPTTVNGVTVSGSSTPSLAVTGTTTVSGTHAGASSGTNTGDQTITLTGDITGTGTGSFATTLKTSPTLVTPSITTGFTVGGVAMSRKIMVGNGTNFVPSTETWAAPGTSGNLLTSNGTNWTSSSPSSSTAFFKTSGITRITGEVDVFGNNNALYLGYIDASGFGLGYQKPLSDFVAFAGGFGASFYGLSLGSGGLAGGSGGFSATVHSSSDTITVNQELAMNDVGNGQLTYNNNLDAGSFIFKDQVLAIAGGLEIISGGNLPTVFSAEGTGGKIIEATYVSGSKLGFFSSTPISKATNTTGIDQLLVNYGLRGGGGSANFTTTIKPPTNSNTTAAITFTGGGVKTTPASGDLEFDGAQLFITPSTTRKRLVMTNVISASNGSIPIGNGTDFTTAVITQGSGMTITNAAGSITIASSSLTTAGVLDFGSTAAGASTDLTITVTGAAVNDVVSVGVANGSVPNKGSFFGWVSATDTVTIRYSNNDLTTAKDPNSGTFKVIVFK